MAFTNLDSLRRREEMNNRLRASANRLNPLFGQQQQGNSYSLPTGGGSVMRGNQIGGASRINVYKAPRPEPTPEELEAQQFEDRANQYQQEMAEFNLGQKEAELEKRRAEAEEIASGRNMLNGRAVTRAEMDEYQRNAEQTAAKAQADFDRENPFYARAKQFVAQNMASPRPQMPGESPEDYERRIQNFTRSTKVNRDNVIQQVYNQMRQNALIRSVQQFRDDPAAYLMGGGMSGQRSNTIHPSELMNYLGQANQMFRLAGGQGNLMDYLLGGNPKGTVQRRRVTPLRRFLPGNKTEHERADAA